VKIERIGIHHQKYSNDGRRKQRDREIANNKHSRDRVEEDSEAVVVEEDVVDSEVEVDSEGEAVMEDSEGEEEEVVVDLHNAEGADLEAVEAAEEEEEDIEHHDTVLLTYLIVKDCECVLAVYHLCFEGWKGILIQFILAHPFLDDSMIRIVICESDVF